LGITNPLLIAAGLQIRLNGFSVASHNLKMMFPSSFDTAFVLSFGALFLSSNEFTIPSPYEFSNVELVSRSLLQEVSPATKQTKQSGSVRLMFLNNAFCFILFRFKVDTLFLFFLF